MTSEVSSDQLPPGWTTATLDECAEIIRGVSFPKTVKKTEPLDGHIACLRTSNVQRHVDWRDLWYVPRSYVKRDGQLVQQSDILISTANSYELVGKVAFVSELPEESTLGAFISIIRASAEILPKFLYYQLDSRSRQSALRELASTTTNISNVSTKKLKTLRICVAPKDEQRAIIAKIEELFSDLDAGVAALERVQANLDRYRASVLKAAVEGRLTAQWRAEHPDVEPADQLLDRILRERREKWEQEQLAKYEAKGKKPPKNWQSKYKEPASPDSTKLPAMPDGWRWVTIGQLLRIRNGYAFKSSDYTSDGVPLVRQADLLGGSVAVESAKRLPAKYLTDHAEYRVEYGDLLIGMSGSIGEVSEYQHAEPGLQNQRTGLVKPSSYLPTRFLTMLMQYVEPQMVSTGRGMTIQNVSATEIEKCVAPLPPETELGA